MPEGPDDQKNLMGEPAETGDFSADENFEPGGENPEEDNTTPEPEPDFSPAEEKWFKDDSQQEQLDAQQQADAATALAGSKQRQLLQIAKERQEAKKELRELEKALIVFKLTTLKKGFLSIFTSKITLLIDILIEQMKKQVSKLTDEAKVAYYTGIIGTISSLIAILTALKMVAAVLDATFSWLTKAIPSCVTIIGCIFFIIIAPFYIMFMALIFMLGAIPLMKGKLTKIDADLISGLKKQRTAWRAERDKIKRKVTLRKQIKDLGKFEKEVERWK